MRKSSIILYYFFSYSEIVDCLFLFKSDGLILIKSKQPFSSNMFFKSFILKLDHTRPFVTFSIKNVVDKKGLYLICKISLTVTSK